MKKPKSKGLLIRIIKAQEFIMSERERCGYNVPLTELHANNERKLCISLTGLRRWMSINAKGELREWYGMDWREVMRED